MKKLIFIFLVIFFIPFTALAWGDCPFGMINDLTPGSCGRFIDTDRDGFCDNSQPAPEKRELALSVNDIKGDESQVQKKKVGYEFFSVLVILSSLYFASLIIAKRKVISLVTHRKIWNLFLLATFFVSAILGLLLVIRTNYKLDLILPFNLLYWHVEAGIAMAIIAIFHIIWHWQYFVRIFKKTVRQQD